MNPLERKREHEHEPPLGSGYRDALSAAHAQIQALESRVRSLEAHNAVLERALLNPHSDDAAIALQRAVSVHIRERVRLVFALAVAISSVVAASLIGEWSLVSYLFFALSVGVVLRFTRPLQQPLPPLETAPALPMPALIEEHALHSAEPNVPPAREAVMTEPSRAP